MLTELCAELKNWFDRDMPKWFEKFTIENGSIDLPLQEGQYFRIIGSTFNDGVYQYPTTSLVDEVFRGAVWAMAVPPAVIALSTEIDAWQAQYADVLKSPYTSESFGGYSYTRASGGSSGGASNDTPSWQSTFASRLNQWRKIR